MFIVREKEAMQLLFLFFSDIVGCLLATTLQSYATSLHGVSTLVWKREQIHNESNKKQE